MARWGRAAITGRLEDLNAFDAPYFHDNSAATLDDLIEHDNDTSQLSLTDTLSAPAPGGDVVSLEKERTYSGHSVSSGMVNGVNQGKANAKSTCVVIDSAQGT